MREHASLITSEKTQGVLSRGTRSSAGGCGRIERETADPIFGAPGANGSATPTGGGDGIREQAHISPTCPRNRTMMTLKGFTCRNGTSRRRLDAENSAVDAPTRSAPLNRPPAEAVAAAAHDRESAHADAYRMAASLTK